MGYPRIWRVYVTGAWRRKKTSSLQSFIVTTAVIIVQTHSLLKGSHLHCHRVNGDWGQFLYLHSHHSETLPLSCGVISTLSSLSCEISLLFPLKHLLSPFLLAQSPQIVLVNKDLVKQKPGEVVNSKQFLLCPAIQTPQRRRWKVKVKVAQSCLTLCDSMDYRVHGILHARILEWVAFPLLQGIFPTQGSNPGLLHCRRILYQLRHREVQRRRYPEAICFTWGKGKKKGNIK